MNSVGDLPDIDFPRFPISTQDPNITFEAENSYVIITWKREKKQASIPLDIWEDFVEYAIDVNTAEKKYKELQKAYEVQE